MISHTMVLKDFVSVNKDTIHYLKFSSYFFLFIGFVSVLIYILGITILLFISISVFVFWFNLNAGATKHAS